MTPSNFETILICKNLSYICVTSCKIIKIIFFFQSLSDCIKYFLSNVLYSRINLVETVKKPQEFRSDCQFLKLGEEALIQRRPDNVAQNLFQIRCAPPLFLPRESAPREEVME